MYTVTVTTASGRVRSTQADTLADVIALTIGMVAPYVVTDADGVDIIEYARSIGGAELVEQVTDPLYQMLG